MYSNTQYFEIEEYREAVEYFDVEYFDATEDPVEKRDEILKMIMLDWTWKHKYTIWPLILNHEMITLFSIGTRKLRSETRHTVLPGLQPGSKRKKNLKNMNYIKQTNNWIRITVSESATYLEVDDARDVVE